MGTCTHRDIPYREKSTLTQLKINFVSSLPEQMFPHLVTSELLISFLSASTKKTLISGTKKKIPQDSAFFRKDNFRVQERASHSSCLKAVVEALVNVL